MRPPGKTPFGAVMAVNGKFLAAFLAGAVGWLCWPESSEWWQFGLLSAVLWLGAIGKFIEGISAIVKIYVREREIARLMALGRIDRPSELASDDALRRAGMTDG